MSKQAMCNALRAFINQRSGIDFRNYGERDSFMGDYRPMLRHGRHARTMLRYAELFLSADDLLKASRAYSGRLQFIEKGDKVGIAYCTGQYFPTEYRNAACAVLAQAIWHYWLANGCANGAEIRKKARAEFGRAIASTWFN